MALTPDDSPVARCHALILHCLEMLELCVARAQQDQCVAEQSERWQQFFGAKESALSVLGKIVSLQKTVLDLQEREALQTQQDLADEMSEADWELLALCVDRWRERQN